MRPSYSIITQPTYEPITIDQAMAHVLVDSEDDIDYLTSLIAVAREYVEGVTGRVCVKSRWRLVAPSWPDVFGDYCGHRQSFPIYRTPLISVESISYFATDSDTLTVMDSATDYRFIAATEPGLVQILGDLPYPSVDSRPDAIQIEFTAGHESAAESPAILRHAVSMLVAHFYEQRVPVAFATANQIPFGLSTLIENQKVGGWIG